MRVDIGRRSREGNADCVGGRETWEHTWERCREWREGRGSWQEALGCVLGEEGEGKWWMREIKEARGEGKRGD